METYREFLDRINSFEKKEVSFGEADFCANPSLAKKVDEDNAFRAFCGDTIVFDLDNATKERLAEYVEKIYVTVPECICEKLISNTFHMTLHDLSNAPMLEDVAVEIFDNELKVLELKKNVDAIKIKMKSKCIFNMVNTSLVLGLYPVDEEEYEKLMKLYFLFDEVKELGYPLTPHITLAYYNVNGFSAESARELEKVVAELNDCELEIELDVKELYYQKFRSMNDYINIFSMSDGRE